ncbi:MAG: uracil-DNA glycosylase [Termitinemataceae bacterium]|nr:MAG: uracil-DNA glycosylase [Termitinemataceae bacterium]
MTADQKIVVADFLDNAESFLLHRYRAHTKYTYEDDCVTSTLQDNTALFVPSFMNKTVENELPAETKKTKSQILKEIAEKIISCNACDLAHTRIMTVPGEGVPHPLALIIGEGPGAAEDQSGRPFVGEAGQLLDRMLEPIGLSRTKNCFIANIVKCRPPGNRDPLPQEITACDAFLQKQIDVLKPKVIVALGNVPSKTLLNTEKGITKIRGCWTLYNGIPFLPTYHPSYLLRDPSQKAAAWEDMKMLCRRLAELDSVYAAETESLRRDRKI